MSPTKAQANVILMHGFNEYAGAFDDVGKYLSSKGVNVWAYDQRGFGRSSSKGFWFGHEKMAADLGEFARLVRSHHSDLPLYVIGMSMGGGVTLISSGKGYLDADGIVLVAPAVWTRKTQPFYQRWALSVARKLFPHWSPSGKGLKIQATDNIPMLRKIWQSPHMVRNTRMDTLAGLVDLMDAAHSLSDVNKLPLLLLYGDKDELVPEKPILQLWKKLDKGGKDKFLRYEKGWHMLMRDLNGPKVMDDILEWIGAGK